MGAFTELEQLPIIQHKYIQNGYQTASLETCRNM